MVRPPQHTLVKERVVMLEHVFIIQQNAHLADLLGDNSGVSEDTKDKILNVTI